MTKTLVLLGFVLTSLCIQAQPKKAVRFFEKAREEIRNSDYAKAKEYLNKALEKSPEYVEAALLMADLYKKEDDLDQSIFYYEMALRHNPPFYTHLFYGQVLFAKGRYEEALREFDIYAASPRANPKYVEEVNKYRRNCKFAMTAMAKPKDYDPINLGSKVNTDQMEYFPSISADGTKLVFTHRKLEGAKQDEDFWITSYDTSSGEWAKAQPLRGFLNTTYNEGAQTITADGNIIYFAACQRPDGVGSCDLYASFYKGEGVWSRPVNLGKNVNTRRWESQPSISSDGRTLYFIRGNNSFDKNLDIFYSELGDDGVWSKAERIKGYVNTKGQETSPFIHFDNQSIYFSSNGHPGMGDLDFFVSRRMPDGSWGKPQNLGYPINTSGQEFSLIVAPDGKTGFFSSDSKEGGLGMLDLYSFELPEESQAIETAYIKGRIINKKTRSPVATAISFSDLKSGDEVLKSQSLKDGRYFSVLPGNSDYALSIRKKGFLLYSKNFSLETQTADRAFVLNVELIPIEVGERVELENVFFAFDSFELDSKSHVELNIVREFLTENPTVKISIEGHTDSQGSKTYNKKLSTDRAKSVYDYLIANGIESGRLAYKGFGADAPLASNDTEEGREKNRRTEMRIIEF